MCKSQAQGGARCPGHAGKALESAQKRKAAVEAAALRGEATPEQVAKARATNWRRLVEYASTLDGWNNLREQLKRYPDVTDPNAQVLTAAINQGADLAQRCRVKENEWRASQGKGPLATPLPQTTTQIAENEAAAAAEAAEVAIRAADPLGLRRDGAGIPTAVGPEVPVPAEAPVQQHVPPRGMPTRPPAPAPASGQALPTTPRAGVRGGLPTRPPVVAPPAAEPALSAREQRAQAATEAREQRARASEEARAQRQAQQAQAAWARQQQVESRRLQQEVSAEVKQTRQWIQAAVSERYAPASTWTGPDRWTTGAKKASMRENATAYRTGVARYGTAFKEAMRAHAGEFTATEMLEAAGRIEAQGRDRISGQVRPRGWYQGYQAVPDETIASVRKAHFANQFGPNETDVLARHYVAANLSGVLADARVNRPRRSPLAATGSWMKRLAWRGTVKRMHRLPWAR